MDETTQQVIIEASAFAEQIANDVGERLLEHFGSIQEALVKNDGTLVTQADLEADRLIADAIQRQYPEHDIVSEELDTVYEGAPWCWIVDPIDGTTNFAQRVPVWGISIALAHEGWPVLSVIDIPTVGLRYHAMKDAGAFENGKPISVMSNVDLGDPEGLRNELFAACSRTFQYFTAEDIPLKPRIIGAAVYNFCLAAAGITVASIDATPKVWDMAAGWLLVHEAGGVVKQLEGEPMFPLIAGQDYKSIAYPQLSAPSEALADELLERIERR